MDVGVDNDRSGDQLGKHAQICTETDKRPVSLRFPDIDIDDVGSDLERIETDSKRQCNVQCVEPPGD